MGRLGGERVTEKDFVWSGAPHTAPALLSLACVFREALKTNEKES